MEQEREYSAKERLLSCLLSLKQKKKVQNRNKNAIYIANVSSGLRQDKKLEFLCQSICPENFAAQQVMPQEVGDIYLSDMDTVLYAFSNPHLLQKALLTAEIQCAFDNNNNNNKELMNYNESHKTHVNVRRRWIRCVLSLSSSVVSILNESTVQSQSEEECVNIDEISLVSLHVRIVKICAQDVLQTLECTASANSNSEVISTNSAFGSFEATVAKSEMQLAQELISTLHDLSCLLRSRTKTIVQIVNLIHVDVPVYLLHMYMYDSAATRLCEVSRYTNNIIDYFISSMPECLQTSISSNSCRDDTCTINNKLATCLMMHWNTHVLQLVFELSCSFSASITNTSTVITDNKQEEELEEYTSNREQCADCVDVLLEILNSVIEMYNSVIGTNVNASRNVISDMQNMWALLNSHFTDEQLHVLHAPSVLVHCVQGISRSPSVVLLYWLHRLQKWHRRASKKNKCTQPLDQKECKTNTTITDTITTMKLTKEQIESVTLLDCLEAMRSVRSCVQPNIAFMMEMQSLWRHSFHE